MLIDGISRKQLQELAIKTLRDADTMAHERAFEARDWPTRPELFPIILVQTPRDRKVSLGRGIIQFNTTITLSVVARVMGPETEIIEKDLDILSAQIENALLCTPSFVQNIQQFTTVYTETVITADAKQQIGEVGMTFECEVYQSFAPDHGVPLKGIRSEIVSNGGTLATAQVNFSQSERQALRRAWDSNGG